MITCVRHGESSENLILHKAHGKVQLHRANPPLTDLGVAQAKVTAKHVCSTLEPGQRIIVWTSQLDRAINTAAPLLKALRKANIDFEYQERVDLNEKKEAVVGIKDNESLAEFLPRVAEFAKQLSISEEDHLIIVGHSVFISALTSLLTSDEPLKELVYCNPNCAITKIQGQELICQGSVDHLPSDLQTGLDFVRN